MSKTKIASNTDAGKSTEPARTTPESVTLPALDFTNLNENVRYACTEIARALGQLSQARNLRKGFDGTRKLGGDGDPDTASFHEEQALAILASAYASLELAVDELNAVRA